MSNRHPGLPPASTDEARYAIRKAHNERDKEDPQSRKAEFKIVRRLWCVQRDNALGKVNGYVSPDDEVGECAMCRVEVVYDRDGTTEGKPMICGPCALRLLSGGNMRQLEALGTWEPDKSGLHDEEFTKRMHVQSAMNKRELPQGKPRGAPKQNAKIEDRVVVGNGTATVSAHSRQRFRPTRLDK